MKQWARIRATVGVPNLPLSPREVAALEASIKPSPARRLLDQKTASHERAALAEARRKAGAEVAARVLAESKKPLMPRQLDVATKELMRRRPELSYSAARKFVMEFK